VAEAEEGCEAGGKRHGGDGFCDPQEHVSAYRQLMRPARVLLIPLTIDLGGLHVKRLVLLGSLAVLACAVAVASASPGPALEAAGPHGIVPPRGHAGHGKPGGSPNLLYHGGGIMTSAAVTSIFWGANWGDSSFAGDKISGLDSLYGTISGSKYIATNTEYSGSNGKVGSSVQSGGHVIDTTSSLTRAPRTTSDVLAEVANEITNPVANGYYPVYTDLPRGHAGYCAWHSWGSIGGVPVQFAFFFNLDGDPGCDPRDSSGLHSQGLAALANVSGHELSEALTDPRGDAWYDSSGAENADKCAWTFNGLESFGGTSWLIQGNWSNNAFNNRSGYDGAGCINGN
jgi:hypothetical protein